MSRLRTSLLLLVLGCGLLAAFLPSIDRGLPADGLQFAFGPQLDPYGMRAV